ncbi:MAG: hypothetical protein ABSH53_07505 [Holophaga sp.]|jgi:hypothetical protein
MKTKLCAAIVAGTLAFPALAGYGKDDTQITFAFSGCGNNARLFAEVLAQAERGRGGKPVAAYADRFAGHSAGAMLALFLTLPHHSDGRPLSANETLVHKGKHAPNILNTLMAGALQSDKAWVQAEIRKYLGAALGSSANLRTSQLPGQVEVLMAEVVKDDAPEGAEEFVIPASFTAAAALSGAVPDANLAELLTAAVSVERLAGHVPLTGAGGESKSARTFMDAGSRGTTDPTPNLIEAAMASGKPAHIFAFEGGFGFDQPDPAGRRIDPGSPVSLRL